MAFRAYDLLKLVEEHGETLTLVKNDHAAYDPATSTLSTGGTTNNYTFQGYFYNYEMGIADLGNVERGMRKCLISALGLTDPATGDPIVPDTEDEITGNGNQVNITNVVTLFSSGQRVCYICDVRE